MGKTEGVARAAGGNDRPTAAVRDGHGSLLRSAPLGTAIRGIRPHCQTDGPQARHALPPERQTRQE